MAARTNRPNHNDSCREKIQTSQLINRLQDSVLSKNGSEPKELTTNQLKAIEILLRKSLPDLSAVSLAGMTQEQTEQIFGWLPTQS